MNDSAKCIDKKPITYQEMFPTKLPVDSLEDDDWLEQDLPKYQEDWMK